VFQLDCFTSLICSLLFEVVDFLSYVGSFTLLKSLVNFIDFVLLSLNEFDACLAILYVQSNVSTKTTD
jgi:hypothetical protein